MTIFGNAGSAYFNKFKLPKNVSSFFKTYKIKKIKSFEKILNKENKYSDEDAKNASDLIINMLNFDYDKRYSVEECLNHPFFTKSDK